MEISKKVKLRIKPIIDWADKKERLFIAGNYYQVSQEEAIKYAKKRIAYVRVKFKEGDITNTQYTMNINKIKRYIKTKKKVK